MFWYYFVLYLVAAIIIYIPVFHKVRIEKTVNNKVKKVITPSGYFFIVAVIVSLILSWAKDYKADEDKINDIKASEIRMSNNFKRILKDNNLTINEKGKIVK